MHTCTRHVQVAVTVLGVAAAMMAYLRSRSDRERDRRADAGLRILTTFAYEWARYFSTLMYVLHCQLVAPLLPLQMYSRYPC
jgi:hypothetical protein